MVPVPNVNKFTSLRTTGINKYATLTSVGLRPIMEKAPKFEQLRCSKRVRFIHLFLSPSKSGAGSDGEFDDNNNNDDNHTST